MQHYSVMLQEAVDLLNVKPDGIYVDGTLGRAGHSSEILRRLDTGHLYSFDIDQQAIDESRNKLLEIGSQFTLIKANFADMKEVLESHGIDKVDGILLDIGVSSPQFDDPERGFSYRYDTRLDMRMDASQSLDAYKVVNEYPYEDLWRILSRYGEEPFARQIARKIEQKRAVKPLETTGELVEAVKEALPEKVKKKAGHPAKQTFQAIRIEVNGELTNLEKGLQSALELLKPQGRLVVISFHSLEDQIVKEIFRNASTPAKVDKRIPLKADEIPQADYTLVNRKPIEASEKEINENHRSHSAKLRAIERR